jgi:type II secretory pathway component PulM
MWPVGLKARGLTAAAVLWGSPMAIADHRYRQAQEALAAGQALVAHMQDLGRDINALCARFGADMVRVGLAGIIRPITAPSVQSSK